MVCSFYQYYVGHILLFDNCYTRRFGSWLYSRIQVIGCRYNRHILLFFIILDVYVSAEAKNTWLLSVRVSVCHFIHPGSCCRLSVVLRTTPSAEQLNGLP